MSSGLPLRFPPDPARLREVRRGARARAMRLGATPAVCDAVSLVIDELVNNAIEHGAAYRRRGVELSVQVGAVQGRLTVDFVDPEMPEDQVRDLARALHDAARGMPTLDSERGRGLFLIAIYMEELRVDVAPGGGLHLHGRLAGE
jgi:anti-sigma regulatory factor (Ser/Thr protein kinase)